MGRHRAYFVSTLTGAITAVLLNLILPPVFGVAGACLAFVLAEFGVALCAFLLCPPNVRAAARTPFLNLSFSASLVMGVILWFVRPVHMHPLLFIGLGCAVYILSWALFGRRVLKKEFEAFV
jgi:O-antigen/teichoic acid export membrane protein